MAQVNLFGPLDAALYDVIAEVVLVLVLLNMVTRIHAHKKHVEQARDGGAEAISRSPLHTASTVLLILASFYYVTAHYHGGMVTAVLVLGMFITDFFEFEGRKVEARRDIPLEKPKGAIAASFLLLLYISYQTLFWIIKGPWDAIV